MQFLTNLISRIGLFVFFLILEIAAIFFMATRSDFHKNAIGVYTMALNGYMSERTAKVKHFINLPDENESLLLENIRLKNELSKLPQMAFGKDSTRTTIDSIYRQKFTYLPAEIVDYSLRKKDNYFLINKGKLDGIKEDMAVLSPNGVVGVVLNSADHYSSILSVLHSRTNIKARVKGVDRFGIIVWPGNDYQAFSLTEIPKYLNVQVGDTVMTAGASAIYPEGALIGKVSALEPNDVSGDYDITVEPFDDLPTIKSVYVVENLDKLDIKKAKEKEDVITQ